MRERKELCGHLHRVWNFYYFERKTNCNFVPRVSSGVLQRSKGMKIRGKRLRGERGFCENEGEGESGVSLAAVSKERIGMDADIKIQIRFD